jgi:hypothetical protein
MNTQPPASSEIWTSLPLVRRVRRRAAADRADHPAARVPGTRSVIAAEDVAVEGFPDRTPSELIDFLCPTHAGCNRDTEVMRIEWRYLDAAPERDRTDEKDLPRRARPPGGLQWPS